MSISLAELAIYPLPSLLEGGCAHTVFSKWLNNKADTLLKRGRAGIRDMLMANQ
jgi:hypothetical protein